MKFLVDRCAGRVVSEWLRQQGDDVLDTREWPHDPGDAELLQIAAAESRVLITIDTDFGTLIFLSQHPHAGIIRLPDVPAQSRISLIERILTAYPESELLGAVITGGGANPGFAAILTRDVLQFFRFCDVFRRVACRDLHGFAAPRRWLPSSPQLR